MSKLEQAKRMAEIEGLDFTTGNQSVFYKEGFEKLVFDPLADGLNHRLMIKHRVKLEWLWDENDGTSHYQAYIHEDSRDVKYGTNPNEIVILSIIEANRGL